MWPLTTRKLSAVEQKTIIIIDELITQLKTWKKRWKKFSPVNFLGYPDDGSPSNEWVAFYHAGNQFKDYSQNQKKDCLDINSIFINSLKLIKSKIKKESLSNTKPEIRAIIYNLNKKLNKAISSEWSEAYQNFMRQYKTWATYARKSEESLAYKIFKSEFPEYSGKLMKDLLNFKKTLETTIQYLESIIAKI